MVKGRPVEVRPLTRGRREAVLRALTARDMHDVSVPDFTRKKLFDELQTDESNCVVALDGGDVLGCAAVHDGGAIAFVDPAREGEGAGSALLAWTEARERHLGHEHHRQWIPDANRNGHRLVRAAGYEKVRTISYLARSLSSLPEPPPPPPGIRLDRPDVERDGRALHAADAAAFSGNADYRKESFETFLNEHLSDGCLDPEFSLVARRGDAVAGFTVCRGWGAGIGYVDLLAVIGPERRQGLGTLLLLSAFADFARADLREAVLDVASDNPGALRVYERAGMTPRHLVSVFEKPVG